jgi:hypothetical protein
MSAPVMPDLFNPHAIALQRLGVAIQCAPSREVRGDLINFRGWLDHAGEDETGPVVRALLGIQ